MPEDPITIEFTYSADDYVEGSRAAALYFAPAKHRVSRVAVYFLTAVGIVGGPWIFLSNPSDHSAWVIGSAVFGLGLWSLYALAMHLWRDRFGKRREFARIEVLQGTRQMRFDETSHHTEASRFVYDASWDCYKACVETANLFLLSQPPGYAIIPKRAFSTQQLAAFQRMLKGKVQTAQPVQTGRGFLIALGVGIAILLALYAALLIFAPKP
jgi:hypothetical protein